MKTGIVFVLLFRLVLSASVISQTDSAYRFELPRLSIIQNEKGKPVKYVFENQRNIFFVSDSLLRADTSKFNYSVKLSDLSKITFHSRSDIAMFAAVPVVIGFAFGFLISGAFIPENTLGRIGTGFGLGVVSGFFGLLLGTLVAKEEYYNLSGTSGIQKKVVLIRIFRKNKRGN